MKTAAFLILLFVVAALMLLMWGRAETKLRPRDVVILIVAVLVLNAELIFGPAVLAIVTAGVTLLTLSLIAASMRRRGHPHIP